MLEILLELLSQPAAAEPSRRTDWRRLRGAMWLEHALWLSGMELGKFADRYIRRGRSESNLAFKWRNGAAVPSNLSAAELEKVLTGTRWVFDLPLYELVSDRNPSTKAIDRVLTSVRKPVASGGWEWQFPDSAKHFFTGISDDSSALVACGGLWSFIAIIALVRQAEMRGDAKSHLLLSMDMYRALPAIMALAWVDASVEQLKDCINSVRSRMPLSACLYDVDWSVIAQRAAEPRTAHIYESGVDPNTGYACALDDPILESKLIRGYDWRERKSRRRT